jgi:hypothetical protein
MRHTSLVSLVVLLSGGALAACGDDTAGTGGAGSGGAAASSGTDAASSGTGTGSGSTSTGDATSTGSGGEDENTVTITLDEFVVQPGEEVYKCQNFANPLGADIEIQEFASEMTPGSHHLLLFYRDGAEDGPLEDCSGLEFAATPYSTQLPQDSVRFPDGVAALLPADSGIRLQSHYLNVTPEPITAQVQVKLRLAEEGSVVDHAGVLFVVKTQIQVEPHTTEVVEFDCDIPIDMKVMKASSHMHKHGTFFTSSVEGETLYETETWDEPEPGYFDPVREISAGDALHFECTFQNDTEETLTFGESAASNEMCILVASFYPTPPGLPTITCQPQ